MKTICFNYFCPNCDAPSLVTATAAVPARITGPPELCHPEEPASIDPGACGACGQEFDETDVLEAASAEYAALQQEESR